MDNITTSYDDVWREWIAFEGDYDLDVPVGYGKTKKEAIDDLKEQLGEPTDYLETTRDKWDAHADHDCLPEHYDD